jgi:hypothetical protein
MSRSTSSVKRRTIYSEASIRESGTVGEIWGWIMKEIPYISQALPKMGGSINERLAF